MSRSGWPLVLAAGGGSVLGLGAAAVSGGLGWGVVVTAAATACGLCAVVLLTRGLAPWVRIVLLAVGGYVALGRGFAYVSPLPERVPLFVGEMAIIAAVALMPHRRLLPAFLADGVGRWTVAWTVYGLLRGISWLADMDFTAAKAMCMVYYTAFLYFGWALMREPATFERAKTVLAVVFSVHLVHAIASLERFGLAEMAPSAREGAPPLLGLGTGGTPYINSVIAGFFFLLVWPRRQWMAGAVRTAGALLSVVALLLMQARAGFVAALIASALGVAGPWRRRLAGPLLAVAAMIVVGGLLLAATSTAITGTKGPMSAEFALAQLWSIAGVAPSGDVADFESLLLGPREGRLEIWGDIVTRTVERGDWVFGLGFARSLLEIPQDDGTLKRSPHNGFVTVFGYLGVVGVTLFVGMLAHALIVSASALGRAERHGDARMADLSLWLLIALAVNASGALFSVIWDSPVQAAPAYLFTGMAVGLARAVERGRWSSRPSSGEARSLESEAHVAR